MKPSERDLAYLWDIYNAGLEIAAFVKGLDLSRFARNKKTRYAVERQLTVIGEAARRVSTDFKDTHPEIPWKGIISQRNVIVHEYGEIRLEKIWAIATKRTPELLRQVEPFIPEDAKPHT